MPEATIDAARPAPKIGVALGSGAARGWAHLGVLRALKELNVPISIYAGTSVGALVSAARLMGIDEEFLEWARSIGPLEAAGTFGFNIRRGGLIDPANAFNQFAEKDCDIEALATPWGAVATDLATGREVWLTKGSVMEACRASSAVPMVLQAARYETEWAEHWLIDGGACNPVPVSLARALGADYVIAVDLNAVTIGLSRFDRPTTRAVVPVEAPKDEDESILAPVGRLIDTARRDLAQRLALAKAKSLAEPAFFETALATIDIVQAHLADARARTDIADIRLTPDLSCGSAAAFDMWEEFDQIGYEATMQKAEEIKQLALLPGSTEDKTGDAEP